MKVLITRRMTDAAEQSISARFDATFRDSHDPLTLAEAQEALAQYDAIIPTLGDAFTADAFGGPIRAKLLANFGVGYNHIDVAAARNAGVDVTNTPGVVTDATADLAVTLLLMTARRCGEGERQARAGEWSGWHPTHMLGQMVSGQNVGIIGMGRIGKAIARRLYHGFGMNVVFHNRSTVSSLNMPARQLPDLNAVMSAVDMVILAVPGGAETRHLIGAEQLQLMGKNGILINISRGDVVDETALIAALKTGVIRSAGLDVYEHEPFIPQELRDLENVTLLPHLGTSVEQTRTEMALRAMQNVVHLSEGRRPADLVN